MSRLTSLTHEWVRVALDVEVRTSVELGGGDFAASHRVELEDDTTVFAKTHNNPPPHFFSTEATGLNWLRQQANSAETATAALSIPKVLHVSDDPPLLILEWIEEANRHHTSEAAFGQALAALHATGFETFGRPDSRNTGSQALPNDPASSWGEFLAERRLLPLARIAASRSSLSPATVGRIEDLASRIDEVVPPEEPPSLLHGDLWAGNRVVDTDGQHWLIDPACFGGHREFDLAMMRLFGGFGDLAFAAYDTAFPLADGWRDRIELHQLAPLIVHAIKFSGGYASAVDQALDRY